WSVSTSRWSRRDPVVLAAAVFVVVVLGFALAALVAQRRVNNHERADLLSEPGQATGGKLDAVGPLNGTDVAQYVIDRQAALQKATGSRVAVVSLSNYRTAAEAPADAGALTAVGVLAAPPGGTPPVA